MTCHGGCGHPCQLLSHGSMAHHPHAGLLQLTLWEYLKTLVKYHCHFLPCLSTNLLVKFFITVLSNRFVVYYRHNASNLPVKHWCCWVPQALIYWHCAYMQQGYVFVPARFCTFFKCTLYKFDAGLNLSITLMMLCPMIQLPPH